MANKIYMDTGLMEQLSNQITQLQRSLSSVQSRVSSSVSEVRRVASEQTGIINKLVTVRKNTQNLYDRMGKLAKAVANSADRWEEAENRVSGTKLSEGEDAGIGAGAAGAAAAVIGAASAILGNLFGTNGADPAIINGAIAQWMQYNSDPSSWSKTMIDKFNQNVADAITFTLPDGSTGVKIGDTVLVIGAGGALSVLSQSSSFTSLGMTVTRYGTDGSWSKQENSIGIGGGWSGKLLYKDENGEWKSVKRDAPDLGNPIDKMYGGKTKADRIGTIATVFSAEAKGEKSLIHGEAKGEAGLASGEASYNVCHGEAEASFKAGLYATKVDADGKVHYSLEPGIEAKAGASFSLFDAEASGKFGNDYLNVHGDAGVSVGKVGAEGELQLGFVDGKFSGHAGASAEAIAAEAHASAGVNVVGIDTKVTGSVNVGIGAHADVGFHDGTLHVDIGASLGLGASVKVDVDVGGFIDNMAEGAGKLVDSVKGMGKSLFSLFG